jgi:ABC-2 type transport system permease protein
MRFWKIFRFEIAWQLRRRSTWLSFAIVMTLAFSVATGPFLQGARTAGYFFNASFVIAAVTVLSGMFGLLVVAAMAGDAATRDVQTRMEPLVYTTPVGKTVYLGGRFFGAFAVSALLLAAVPIGLVIASRLPGLQPELVGPFRPDAYLGSYLLLALPNAFIATALLYSMAALSGRALSSYVGAALLVLTTILSNSIVAKRFAQWGLAKQLDPFGYTVMSELSRLWTPLQKSTLPIRADGALLANRILWLAIALGVLALTHVRFHFEHHTARRRRFGFEKRDRASVTMQDHAPVVVPPILRTFGAATRAWQLFAVTMRSFRQIVTSWGALALAVLAVMLVLTAPGMIQHLGVPLFPTTDRIATVISHSGDLFWIIVPLLTVLYAGELVWRERDAGISEITDTTPVPDWIAFIGKFAGLGLMLALLQVLIMAAGIVAQMRVGYYDFELGLYLRILFGLQLTDYLLFAMLALVVHGVVNQKYVGHIVLLLACAFLSFAPALGIEHNLLVYGSDPGWQYSAMRGFDPFVAPVVWFKLHWMGWALFLALIAKLLWVRGAEQTLKGRLRLAVARFTRADAWTLAAALGVVVMVGSFIFYNTNVLNAYRSTARIAERRAIYERRYRRFERVPQPQVTATWLRVELYPDDGEARIHGTYRLENKRNVAMDVIHLATNVAADTTAVTIDRPFKALLVDEDLGHRIYRLQQPLQPGESVRLGFDVHYGRRGFRNREIDVAVARNATHLTQEWLPRIGYQSNRELSSPGERSGHGLAPRPESRSLEDADAEEMTGRERIDFEAIIGTAANQVAIAPGTLRRTWSEHGRRYFHYVTDAPIRNSYAFYSAAYALREAQWKDPSASEGRTVDIQIFHDPRHSGNLDRMVRSAEASLSYCTEQFGPYPYHQLRLIEAPGSAVSLHADPIDIVYFEGFAGLNPEGDRRNVDLPFAVVAHEVAHQWWGNQLSPAPVEGAPGMTESLAWYSAFGAVEKAYGSEHLRRFLDLLREAYLSPRARADVPLLRADRWFVAYRKGPFAMYALREYLGEERVNLALRRLFRKHGAGTPPLPTPRDFYAELQAVTPQSLRYLLVDLFEVNTYWDLSTTEARAERTGGGAWRVTLSVTARKVAVDPAAVETERPMDDLIEIGVFGAAANGQLGKPLYLQKHRLHSGQERITVTVPSEPARAWIDPRNLLIDPAWRDNVVDIQG